MTRYLPILAFLLGVLMVWSAQPAVAQSMKGSSKPNVVAGRRLQRWNAIAKQLNLTEEQKAKIKRIAENARQQAQKIRHDGSLAPQEKRSRLRDLRRNTQQEIRSVLTPEQVIKLQRLRARQWHQWQIRRAYRAGKVSKALGLGKAQEEAIANILRRAGQERRRIWADTALTPQQKWQKMIELRRRVLEELRKQLAPEPQRKRRMGLGMRRWALMKRWQRVL